MARTAQTATAYLVFARKAPARFEVMVAAGIDKSATRSCSNRRFTPTPRLVAILSRCRCATSIAGPSRSLPGTDLPVAGASDVVGLGYPRRRG